MTRDYARVIQVEVGGQVLTENMAQYIGSLIVNAVDRMLVVTSEYNVKIDEATARVILARNEWLLESYGKTTVEIR